MSDFLYSSIRNDSNRLAASIRSIYKNHQPDTFEFDGNWGSLAISKSLYTGFDPFETNEHIIAVAGGPVLAFRSNDFLNGMDRNVGSRAILERWVANHIDWSEDLSGPFAIFLVHKATGIVTCVTDMMMFVPVYKGMSSEAIVVGTHVDAVARGLDQSRHFDQASLVDFILHGAVTYPYTVYEHVSQCHPGAVQRFSVDDTGTHVMHEPHAYWRPEEHFSFFSLAEAADALRSALQNYVDEVTSSMSSVAHFLSGGEDSRALAASLSTQLHREAFIFLDRLNHEGRIAARAAKSYGTGLNQVIRPPNHYLNIIEEASWLVGLGHEFQHSHTLNFHLSCGLREYPAVFGGYAADALLKGMEVRQLGIYKKLPFVPKIALSRETRSQDVTNPIFAPEVLSEVTRRRQAHVERVRVFRPATVHEWFALWPMTMRPAVGNLYTNRRLFASYEPFTASGIVKISASVPTRWKLNRRLTHAAFKPYLAQSRWVPTSDGRYPYFPWWINSIGQTAIRVRRTIIKPLIRNSPNEGPWSNWQALQTSSKWNQLVASLNMRTTDIPLSNSNASLKELLDSESLNISQRLNLLQSYLRLTE